MVSLNDVGRSWKSCGLFDTRTPVRPTLTVYLPFLGIVNTWAAFGMGMASGSLPWYTMMVLHKRSALLQKVDDTLAVFHTHAVAGILGGLLSGIFADQKLVRLFYGDKRERPGLAATLFTGEVQKGLRQVGLQVLGAAFITAWNVLVTTLICLLISKIVPLRMKDEDLKIGDDAVHGEEAYALWGDGEKTRTFIARLNKIGKPPDVKSPN